MSIPMRCISLTATGALALVMVMSSNAFAQTPPAPVTSAAPQGSLEMRRMVDLLERLDRMEREVRQLRGDLEVEAHDVKELKQRQRELYLDVDRRLRALEVGGTRSGAGGSPAPAPAPNQGPAASPSVMPSQGQAQTPPSQSSAPAPAAMPSPQERSAYEQAFNLLKDGRYPQAIRAFDSFLKAYPRSQYAGNAQYWLGEAHYVSRNFKQAAVAFGKVVSNYSDSPKVPDAMLKLGYTEYELDQWQQARATLQNVTKRYPNSTAAQLAQTRLQRMRKEGH